MDASTFNRELQKYKIVRLEDHYRPRMKRQEIRTGSKPLLLEQKLPVSEHKLRSTSVGVECPSETFYTQMESALVDILSPSEIVSFIREMKKGQSDVTDSVNLEDLERSLAQ